MLNVYTHLHIYSFSFSVAGLVPEQARQVEEEWEGRP